VPSATELAGDLVLRQVTEVPQDNDLTLALRQRSKRAVQIDLSVHRIHAPVLPARGSRRNEPGLTPHVIDRQVRRHPHHPGKLPPPMRRH
jgi:hypothetical protein